MGVFGWGGGSISPGSTFFDFNNNLGTKTMKKGMGKHDSLVFAPALGRSHRVCVHFQIWAIKTGLLLYLFS